MMSLTPKGTYKLMARAIDALKDQMNAGHAFMPAGLFIPFLKYFFKMMG